MEVTVRRSQLELIMKIVQGNFEELPEYYSQSLKSIVKRMIVVDPAKRWSIEDLFSSIEVMEAAALAVSVS